MARAANGGRLTCEICLAIDVREWKRRGLLRPGQMFPVFWNRAGVPCGSISVRTETDAVVLIFRSQHPGETEWKSTEQRVPILWTTCNLRRPSPLVSLCGLFKRTTLRPARRRLLRRGRSVRLPALLRISLRQPAGEPAKSIHQALAKHQNAARWQPRPATPFPKRSRGMHQRTYMRLQARDLLLLKASVGALHKRLSR